MVRTIALCLALVIALAFISAPIMAADLAKGEAIAQGCKCHGTQFHGEEADEIVKNLMAFKEGKRFNKIMQKKAEALSAEDMQDVAAWFASQAK